MDELISRITSNVGIDEPTAKKAVGLILGFLQREAADGPVAQMIEGIPGGPEAVAEHGGAATGGGIMGLGQQLMSAGLGMGEISGVARQIVAYSREKVGDGPVDEVVASVPGLSQFV